MNTDQEYTEFISYARGAFPGLADLFRQGTPEAVLSARKRQWRTAPAGVSFHDALAAIDAMVKGDATGPKYGANDMAQLPTYVIRFCRDLHAQDFNSEVYQEPAQPYQPALTGSMRADGLHCQKLLREARLREGKPGLDPRNVQEIQDYLDRKYGAAVT